MFVIPAETLKVHSGRSSKPSAPRRERESGRQRETERDGRDSVVVEGLKSRQKRRGWERERAGEVGFNTLAALICSISVVTSSARSMVITTVMVAIARHRQGIKDTRPGQSRGQQSSTADSAQEFW